MKQRIILLASLCLAFLSVGVLAENSIVMDVQLPFVDNGHAYYCMQNSDDCPSHGRNKDDCSLVENAPYTRYDLDFGMSVGTIVVAAANGTFYRQENPGGFGYYARIDHGNGYWTIYGHLDSFIAQNEQGVIAGQPIAYSGNTGYSTGAHLHFGVHSGDNLGVSERMNVHAFDTTTNKLADLATGLQTDARREFVCGAGKTGNQYEARPIGKVFGDYTCRSLTGSNGVLCWTGNSSTCEDGNNHVRFYHTSQGYQSESGNWSWCYKDAGDGGQANVFAFLTGGYGVGGSYNGNPNQVNLKLDFDVMDKRNDVELIAGRDTLGPMTVNLRTRATAKYANARDWAEAGRDTISVNWYVRYQNRDGSWTAWDQIGDHGNMTIDKLTKDAMIQETRPYQIQTGDFIRVEFKSRIDTDHEVDESDEGDNASRIESYDYDPNLYADCDLAINTARLTNSASVINKGDSYGLFLEVINRSTTKCPYSIRSSYSIKYPGQSGFVQLADDGTDWSELNPGQTTNEWTRNDPFVADQVGVYTFRACADYQNAEPESNEGNNCLYSTFTVRTYLPDLVIAQLGLTNGRSGLRQGDRFGLTALVKNVGPKTAMDSRMAYYLQYPGGGLNYVADDGVGQLELGQDSTELTLNEPFTASVPGWYQFYAMADYQGARTEADEGNNGASMWFYVEPTPLPNLIVTGLWLPEGTSIKKGTYIHPRCTVQNVGNAPLPVNTRTAYYVDMYEYRDSDDTGALCPGCSITTGPSGNFIKMGNTGTRVFRCCADYDGRVGESNEGDNCATMTFTVRK